MNSEATLSRRAALWSLAASPLLSIAAPVAEASSAETHLLALGRDFDAVAATLDQAINSGADVDWSTLDELGRLDDEILATPAYTIEGLCVKARIICRKQLGDLDLDPVFAIDQRMALSIVRDLIRLCDPSLERPGALRRLVEENERGASSSVTRKATVRLPNES